MLSDPDDAAPYGDTVTSWSFKEGSLAEEKGKYQLFPKNEVKKVPENPSKVNVFDSI